MAFGLRIHCGRFFTWYNDDHRHSGIGMHVPADVHYGRAEAIRDQRGAVLLDAYAEHPERFVRKIPTPPTIPDVAWINKPEKEVDDSLNQ
jgi:putative transposase